MRTPTSTRCLPTAQRPNCPPACWSTPGNGESSAHKIKHAGKTIEVASLDLAGTPEDILAEVRRLAERVRAGASDGARVLVGI